MNGRQDIECIAGKIMKSNRNAIIVLHGESRRSGNEWQRGGQDPSHTSSSSRRVVITSSTRKARSSRTLISVAAGSAANDAFHVFPAIVDAQLCLGRRVARALESPSRGGPAGRCGNAFCDHFGLSCSRALFCLSYASGTAAR